MAAGVVVSTVCRYLLTTTADDCEVSGLATFTEAEALAEGCDVTSLYGIHVATEWCSCKHTTMCKVNPVSQILIQIQIHNTLILQQLVIKVSDNLKISTSLKSGVSSHVSTVEFTIGWLMPRYIPDNAECKCQQ